MTSKRIIYSVVIAAVVITSTLFVVGVYLRPPYAWYSAEYTNESDLTSIQIYIYDFHDAALNIRFVDSDSLLYHVDYLAEGPNAIKIQHPEYVFLYAKGDIKVLNVSLGSGVAYEISVESQSVYEPSTNLTTTITYDENALMDSCWFGYEVKGGSLTIIVKDTIRYVGDAESTIRMSGWPNVPDLVNLQIDLPDTVGGYAFLYYDDLLDVTNYKWYPNMYVNGGYPTYATNRREGYRLALLIQATSITGFLT